MVLEMETGLDEERWLLANNSTVDKDEEDDDNDDDGDEEEEEETLSFVDLPQTQHSKIDKVEEKESVSHEIQEEDFNFCRSFSLKSEMCTADEVFFQGQILPLRRRHSVSSEKRLIPSRSVSRSESMDRYYYSNNGLFSSRSSSNSSSSYSWSGNGSRSISRNGSANSIGVHPKPPRNQFHSHPSPSPRIHNQGVLNYNPSNTNYTKKSKSKSPMWSIFRLGLVTPPPEIVLHDFKTRSKRSNSRNSTNSNSSGSVKEIKKKKKKKRVLFGAGCKCSADAIDTAVTSKIVTVGNENVIKSSTKQQETKKEMSHHRTFEWLKQLSLEATAAS